MSIKNQKRIYWSQYQGLPILVMDFSGASASESLALMDDFCEALKGQVANSVRMLTDVTDAAYDPAIANKWKAVRLQNDSAIRASAVFGLSGLVGVAIRSFVDLTVFLNLPKAGKKLRIFNSKDQALAWLIKA